MGKTGGGKGTNQYQVKGQAQRRTLTPEVIRPKQTLMGQAADRPALQLESEPLRRTVGPAFMRQFPVYEIPEDQFPGESERSPIESRGLRYFAQPDYVKDESEQPCTERFELVDPSSMVYAQDFVVDQHVDNLSAIPAQVLSHPDHPTPAEAFVLRDGQILLRNGTHRCAAALKRREKIWVKIKRPLRRL